MAGALENIADKPAELRSYDPPMKDKIAYFLADALGDDDRSSVRAAKKITDAGQFVSDYGTLPFYFTPAAPVAAAFDVSRGIVYDDPIEVGLGAFGIARPLKSIAPTISDAAEKALSSGFGAAAVSMETQNFLSNLGSKAGKE